MLPVTAYFGIINNRTSTTESIHTFLAAPLFVGADVFFVVDALALPAITFLGAAVVVFFVVAAALGVVALPLTGFLTVTTLDGGLEF